MFFQKKKLLEFDRQKNVWLNNICAPLFKNTPITGFAYMEFYNEKEYFHISTDSSWSELCLGFESNSTAFEQEIIAAQNAAQFHVYYWPFETDDYIISYMKKHNFGYGISIYKKENNFLRVFNFAGSLDSPLIYNFYLKKMHVLEEFIWHFEAQSRHILSANVTKENSISYAIPMNLSIANTSFADDDPKFNPQKIPFYVDGSRKFITPREKKCLAFLSQGHSAKLIAQHLDVSYRTVEKTIENLKIKTNQIL